LSQWPYQLESVREQIGHIAVIMGDVGNFVNLLDRINRIFRIIFCLHFQLPEEIENGKSLREGGREGQ